MLKLVANHPDLTERSFSRILLVKPSSLGDVVHALPVLNGLRHRYPEARIDWLIGSTFAPLLEGHPAISNLIPFDRRKFGGMARRPGVAVEFVRFLNRLRRTRYELVVDLQGLFRSGFISWTTRAPIRIGFRDAREGARRFYTHHLSPLPADTHAVDRNYAVADMLGFSDVPVAFPLPVGPDMRRSADRLLEDSGSSSPLILIAPGARWETKRWPVDRFAAVTDALTTRGARCVIVGSPDESARCAEIASRCRTAPLNLAGRTSLPELVATVDRADLVLCHDSAVAHLAVAVETPVVCITGPTNPARTGPYRGGIVVRLPLDCAPCYLRRRAQCPHDHRCMVDLSEVQVLEAVHGCLDNRLLSQTRSAPAARIQTPTNRPD